MWLYIQIKSNEQLQQWFNLFFNFLKWIRVFNINYYVFNMKQFPEVVQIVGDGIKWRDDYHFSLWFLIWETGCYLCDEKFEDCSNCQELEIFTMCRNVYFIFQKKLEPVLFNEFFEVLSEVKGRCWEYIAYRMKSYRDNEDWQSILRVFI